MAFEIDSSNASDFVQMQAIRPDMALHNWQELWLIVGVVPYFSYSQPDRASSTVLRMVRLA